MHRFIFCFCVFVSLVFPIHVFGQQPASPPRAMNPGPPPPPVEGPGGQVAAPPLKMVAPGVFEIGGVHLFKKEGTVKFPATVNMDNGLLEYLIVGEAGKVHESLLRTTVEPYSLQIALLLLGLEGTTNPLGHQGEPRPPEGDPVTLWVEYQKGGTTEKLRIEEWVLNKEKDQPVSPMEWVFTGSVIWDGVFMAQAEKSIVAVFHDPVAMIDNPLPEGASDEMWYANEKTVPPVGTEVSIIIRKEIKKVK